MTGGAGLAALLLATALAPPAARASALDWWIAGNLEKVRPEEPVPAGGERGGVELSAARNEFEAFQLVLRAREAAIADLDVAVGDLLSPAGARLPARWATVARVDSVRLETPSSIEGGTGSWPDPLLPGIDSYAGERRSGLPFTLPPRRAQPLWVELYVPEATAAGTYRGELRVTAGGRPAFSVPIALEVWPFALPSTASLATSYGFSGLSALEEHRGGYTDERDLLALTRRYATAALRHRVSLHGGTMAPPPARFAKGVARVDWSGYDREVADFLDGTVFGRGEPLAGARATSIDLRTLGELSEAQRVLYWRAWAEHFRERGWLDRLFLYVWDEPTPEVYPAILRQARLLRRADRQLRSLLTEPLAADLAAEIDLWVPLLNCLDERRGAETCGQAVVPRRAYAAAERRGARVWGYHSCASHGCGIVGGKEYTGWPSYAIDAPAAAARLFPWIAWRDGLAGELYYNTVETYGREGGPWRKVHAHGGNGDGTLFYPGTPARIGGRTDVPVESLRLKLIRDGLEDYEYLKLLAAAGGRDEAHGWAERVAAPASWAERTRTLATARAAIGRTLATRAAGGRLETASAGRRGSGGGAR
jgi:hypothetical protein